MSRHARRATRALLAAVLVLPLAACGGAVGDPDAAAVVNGAAIPLDTVAQRYESVRRDPQLAQQLAADEDGSFKARVQARLLTQMIQAELLSQAAEDIGIEITDADIEAERQSIIEQVGGQEAFDQIIEENALSERDVRDQIRDLVVEREVEEALGADVQVSDADVRAFYEENRATRYDRVRASHILVPTREEAERVMERLQAGEDFAALAQELSQDPGSAQQGGDLGEFTRGRLVPEFEEAAFGAEVGELVGPIQTLS
ncbi:MAG TPA: peptidylprolyl isomerase, partial [Egibacteraceae bacterium]|nr:peptidylprolyl isomerase [Egibacteraceae bacterium]